MKTVILEVRSPKEAMDRFAQAWNTNKQQTPARISFASVELLWIQDRGVKYPGNSVKLFI